MYIENSSIVFPEGDIKEISGRLGLNQIADVNGNPQEIPLPTNKTIAYRIARVSTKENKGSSETRHFLELLNARKLIEYCE